MRCSGTDPGAVQSENKNEASRRRSSCVSVATAARYALVSPTSLLLGPFLIVAVGRCLASLIGALARILASLIGGLAFFLALALVALVLFLALLLVAFGPIPVSFHAALQWSNLQASSITRVVRGRMATRHLVRLAGCRRAARLR